MPRLSDYGMSEDDFRVLWDFQEGRCWACSRRFTKRLLAHIDHDHRTGKVRALLCNRCNQALGFLHDNASLLMGLYDVLRYPSADEVFDTPRLHKNAPPSKETP